MGRFFNEAGNIVGKTTYQPAALGPLTVGNVNTQIFPGQTTPASHTGVVIATLPLPGTTGADATRGLFTLNVEVEMQSTTTADAAYFKLCWSWSVQTIANPIALGALVTSLSTGTNSGAPPAGWSATIQLDGSSLNAQVAVDGDATLTVNVKVLAQYSFTD